MKLSCFHVPDEFAKYCEEVASTSTWGGQLEVSVVIFFSFGILHLDFIYCILVLISVVISLISLQVQALSQALKMSIDIYQADSPVLTVGEEHNSASIILS